MIYGTFLHTNCCTVSISMQKFSPTSKTLSGKKKTPYYLCAAVQLHIHEFYKLMHNTAREREKRGVNWSVRGERHPPTTEILCSDWLKAKRRLFHLNESTATDD